MAAPAPWKLLTALWTVYLVWGSTYLAIKLSVRTLPVFLSAGSRFLLAGVLLALILWLQGPQHPGDTPGARLVGAPRPGAARARRRPDHARRDADRLERRGDDRRHGAAAGDPPAHARTRAGRTRDAAERPRRPGGARADRDPRRRRELERDRPGDRPRRDHLLVARLLLRAPAAAPRRRLRRDDLGDAQRRRLSARARRRHRRALDDGRGRLQLPVDRGLALSRHLSAR